MIDYRATNNYTNDDDHDPFLILKKLFGSGFCDPKNAASEEDSEEDSSFSAKEEDVVVVEDNKNKFYPPNKAVAAL